MIEELRSIARPGLQEALGWVGFRVDDIYGANVGKLEDVWVDPQTGEPRWLLVRSGRFGGHHRLIPFEDATAGAGHIWIPFERDSVRHAPGVSPSESLTRELDSRLKAHYAAARVGAGASVTPRPAAERGGRPQVRRGQQPREVAPAAPIPLSRAREQRRRDTTAASALDGLAVEVSEAAIRLEGVGELDGQPVEIMLEGQFTGTVRPLAEPGRAARA